ncbi:hypothetical protein KKG48_00135 [Patescibacteria group bacterium]|nr:hypothetical protein [Patescibacteria group bacterium]MCG2694833.1 hypothetical protein [Candidatus Parcubacteria bacterium]
MKNNNKPQITEEKGLEGIFSFTKFILAIFVVLSIFLIVFSSFFKGLYTMLEVKITIGVITAMTGFFGFVTSFFWEKYYYVLATIGFTGISMIYFFLAYKQLLLL